VIRSFLDEMSSQVIAAIVRESGIDIVSVHERQAEGAADSDVLSDATSERRCVITHNHRHFVPLTRVFYDRGLPHSGIVLVAGSVPTNAYAAISHAIIRFAQENPDGLQPYEIRWLDVDLSRASVITPCS
jgi:predicted nuclease of predicted toxin-antitoxin system